MNTSPSLARLYELLDRVSALEAEMQSGGWSFHMVSLRHDAIRILVEACQDQISMPPRRRAKFGQVPYLDLTAGSANSNQEIEHG
jgi:hypothetical protein